METKNIEKQVWDKVLLARHKDRPTAVSLINYLIDDFVELHGDRLYRDDSSIVGGIGFLDKIPGYSYCTRKGS